MPVKGREDHLSSRPFVKHLILQKFSHTRAAIILAKKLFVDDYAERSSYSAQVIVRNGLPDLPLARTLRQDPNLRGLFNSMH